MLYSGSRHTALSPPAFEQYPLGCAPTGPLRPLIGAHVKRPSTLLRQPGLRAAARSRSPVDRGDKGLSGWRALGRQQFKALVAPPSIQHRPKEGRNHVDESDAVTASVR